jgi:hypothetical protein
MWRDSEDEFPSRVTLSAKAPISNARPSLNDVDEVRPFLQAVNQVGQTIRLVRRSPGVGQSAHGSDNAFSRKQRGLASVLAVMTVSAATHGPNGGAADSLDDAKAAFRAAWAAAGQVFPT